jgi:hypothetical protein
MALAEALVLSKAKCGSFVHGIGVKKKTLRKETQAYDLNRN